MCMTSSHVCVLTGLSTVYQWEPFCCSSWGDQFVCWLPMWAGLRAFKWQSGFVQWIWQCSWELAIAGHVLRGGRATGFFKERISVLELGDSWASCGFLTWTMWLGSDASAWPPKGEPQVPDVKGPQAAVCPSHFSTCPGPLNFWEGRVSKFDHAYTLPR